MSCLGADASGAAGGRVRVESMWCGFSVWAAGMVGCHDRRNAPVHMIE